MNGKRDEARIVFDKTAKGREEIASRCHRLAPRLRPLLVLADGKQDRQDLLKMVAGIGLDAAALEKLLVEGYVASRIVEPPPPAPQPELPPPEPDWMEGIVPEGM